MTKWFTSDLHIGHANIIEYCDRPYFNVDQMNEDMVRRYNDVVGTDDEVWILGDLCMGKIDESLLWVGQMNGVKYLLPGNHDRMFNCQGTKYANMVQKYVDAGIEKVVEPQVVMASLCHDIDGRPIPTILACHFPFAGDHDDQVEDRFQEHRPKDLPKMCLVHGHTHGLWRKNRNMVDVGVDAWGGYPVSFHDVAALFQQSPEVVERLPWV